ncbi:Panacea domain-containing protein [Terrisporobacter sp.]|uniref:Panacea domain-containing protein n=1 Tax=Terrisporobacter sp. TaxID=1965305 RepID=UPI0026249967|nr:Panacea domain-containing protein [Terrisporobacter sp.]
MNLKTFAKLVLFFANNTKTRLYKTKLNKLLFYTQFLFYKKYEQDLLNTDFVCDYFGPVIEDIDSYLENIEEKGLIKIESTTYGKYINPVYKLSEDAYSQEELFVLNKVAEQFSDFSSSEISKYSHDEILWIDTDLKNIIPLKDAYKLNEFK